MSRVADALLKAGEAQLLRADLGESFGNEDAGVAVSDVHVPWDVEPDAEAPSGEPETAPRPRLVPPAPAPVRQQRPDFLELVQRVFRPGSEEPVARTVTFLPLSAAGARPRMALDVAATLAGFGVGTVCVVDASFGAAALHDAAGVPAAPGLCDALLASRPATSVAVPLGRQMWLVPSGDAMSAPPDWLPQALARAVRQLAAQFDFVIVQAPPFDREGTMPALFTLAPATDGTVLTIDMDHARRDVAETVVSRLRESGISVLGAVVVKGSYGSGASDDASQGHS